MLLKPGSCFMRIRMRYKLKYMNWALEVVFFCRKWHWLGSRNVHIPTRLKWGVKLTPNGVKKHITSIEADFACNAYCKHTCKVHVHPSHELVHFKKCFSAFSSNTPDRHCRKKTIFFFFKRTNSLCNCVYSTHYRQSLPRLTSQTAPSQLTVYSHYTH